MLELVANHSQKLKELVVTTKRGQFLPVIRMLQTGPVNLEKCHLVPTKGESSIFENKFSFPMQFVNLIHCKKLQDFKFTCEPAAHLTSISSPVSLTSLEVMDLSFLIGSPVKSLKRLVLRHPPEEIGDGYPWRTIEAIQHSFQGLTHLEITFAGRNPYMERPSRRFTFPDLRSLRVRTRSTSIVSNGAPEAGDFFDHLRAPSLKALRLDWHSSCSGYPAYWPHLKIFVERSSTNLDTLYLNKVEFTDAEVLPLLECSPNLRVLFLSGRNLSGYLVECLTLHKEPNKRKTNLCPYIRDLTLRMGKQPAPEPSIMKLVSSRPEEYEDDPDSGVLLRCVFNMIHKGGYKEPIWDPEIQVTRAEARMAQPEEF